jgi:hypothetical protein
MSQLSNIVQGQKIKLRLRDKVLGRLNIEAALDDFLTSVQFAFPSQELMDGMWRGQLYEWGTSSYGDLFPQAAFIVKLTQTKLNFLTHKRPRLGDEEVLVIIPTGKLLEWIV